MAKVPCTCGCGQEVTNPTKQNHLRGHGTTALQARVLAETKSLRTITRGRQEQNLRQKPGSKKRSHSDPPDQENSCKRLKAAQLKASPEPENFQADTDSMNPLPVVVAQLSKVVERTRHAMEQHWGARQGKGYNDDGEDGDNVQDEDDNNNDNEDEDDKDGDKDKDRGMGMRKRPKMRTKMTCLLLTLYQAFLLGTCLVKPSSVKLQL